MRNPVFAARSHIRAVVLCTLLTLGLTACGSDEGSSASTAAAANTGPLISPSVGLIDRSAGDKTQGTAPATGTTNPPSSTAPPGSTPVAGSPTPVTHIPPPNPISPPKPVPPPKPISTGTATLDWTPPTENSDGSALTNLAGYTVYYGTSPDKLTESVKVSNPGLTAYTMTNLTSGTWYFAVT